jgi:hypothetical protein
LMVVMCYQLAEEFGRDHVSDELRNELEAARVAAHDRCFRSPYSHLLTGRAPCFGLNPTRDT